eukprot:5853-Heterococcus_DN1.PRE.2
MSGTSDWYKVMHGISTCKELQLTEVKVPAAAASLPVPSLQNSRSMCFLSPAVRASGSLAFASRAGLMDKLPVVAVCDKCDNHDMYTTVVSSKTV